MKLRPLSVVAVVSLLGVACASKHYESDAEAVPNTTEAVAQTEEPAILEFDSEHSGQSFLSCDGFLTRFETGLYCSEETPAEWRAFEFNGQAYFKVPLGTDESSLAHEWRNGAIQPTGDQTGIPE